MTRKPALLDVIRRVLSAPLLALLWLYQKLARPLMPPLCRFYPSCSDYAVEAVKLHGPLRGSLLAAKRVSRCHPFHEGGVDPVPGSDLEKQRALAQADAAQ